MKISFNFNRGINFPLFFILISYVIGCNSCTSQSEKENKTSFLPLKEISFNVGFPTSRNGVFNNGKQTYFYFADITSKKKIKIFTIDGIEKWNVSLDEIIKKGDEIEDLVIISPDTIIILSLYTNKLFFINKNGNCWKKIFLDSLIKPINGDEFEYRSPLYNSNFCVDKNTIILRSDWMGNKNKEGPAEMLSNLKYYYSNSLNGPAFLKLTNLYSDSITYKFDIDKFYTKTLDSLYLTAGKLGYTNINNKFFCFYSYSNKIFELDINSLKVKKDKVINSDFTKIGCKFIPINKTTVSHLQQFVNESFLTGGIIDNVFYDKKLNLYYVLIRHAIENKLRDELLLQRPWSLLVYDTNFTKLKEFPFKAKSYLTGDILFCENGILISNNFNTRKDYDKKIARYMLFKVNK